jgi:hypothetical protein
MPSRANGCETSQTRGQTTSASSANGPLTVNRMNQATKNNRVFTAGA